MIRSKRKKAFLGLGFALYTILCGSLLLLIDHLTPHPAAQIKKIELCPQENSLKIRGEHLDQNIDVVLVPSPPTEESVITERFTWGDAFDIKIKDGIAWVANNTNGLLAYNIEDPTRPYVISSLDLPGKSRAWSLEISGQFAFISSTLNGLYIVDLSNPHQPKLLSHVQIPGVTESTISRGELLFIASGTKGLHIVNIKDKKHPRIISSLDIEGYIHSVTLHKEIAYLSGGGLKKEVPGITYAIDISIPEKPNTIKKFIYNSKAWDSLIVNNKLICGTMKGVTAIDLNIPFEQQHAETIVPDISVNRLFHQGNHLYVISRRQRVFKYALEPEFTYLKTYYTAKRACREMDILGNYAFLASGNQGLFVLDLTSEGEKKEPILSAHNVLQAKEPFYVIKNTIILVDKNKLLLARQVPSQKGYRIEKSYHLPGAIKAITTKGSCLFFGINHYGIYQIDLEQQHAPSPELILPLSTSIRSISIKGTNIYICQRENAIIRVSLSDNHPKETSIINDESYLITIHSNMAYVIETAPKGLAIYQFDHQGELSKKVSKINFPKWLARGDEFIDLFLDEEILFIASYKGIRSVDISKPNNPQILDSIELSRSCRSVQVDNKMAYINHQFGGLTLVDLSDPHQLKELCYVDTLQKFFISEEKMFNVDLVGDFTFSELPQKLPRGIATTKAIQFPLPTNIEEGKYDVYVSDNHSVKEIKKALKYERQSGWFLNNANDKIQLNKK